MHYDFSSVQDTDSFASVPEGVYRCRIAEIRERSARDGSVMWSFRLEVLDGDWAGRTAAWDSITWSERGIYRVKKVLEAFGHDVSGELELASHEMVDLTAQASIEREEREDPLTGRRQIRNRVPYQGYAPLDEPLGMPGTASGDAPASDVGDGAARNGTASDEKKRSGASASRRVDPEAAAPVDGWGGQDE